MQVSGRDRDMLRRLAEQTAAVASLPGHSETREMWRRLNDLDPVKPMVWITEVPWHEMDVDGELALRCEGQFFRYLEWQLRQTLYEWRHLRGDMVVEAELYCPLVIHESGFGLHESTEVVRTDERSSIISRHYRPQIRSEADVARIRAPEVTYDAEATEERFQCMQDVLGDILLVEKRGAAGFWFAPWDQLVTWWGVREALEDLVLRPELVRLAMERLVQAHLERLDQYEKLNLLSLNDNNTRIGSGGFGYTRDLPQPDFDGTHVRAADLWGCATAQIFSEVSPQMHEEFALRYEKRWMARFGLSYYGCCEPLHHKIDLLRQVPNLRKVSMSPRADMAAGAARIGRDYVISHKPNPAILAGDTWSPEAARAELEGALEKARGCAVEVILKDISTVRYDPQRLWEWASIAAEVTAKFASG